MKKILAICSIFFTVCTTFTACGSSEKPYYQSNPDSGDLSTTDRAEEFVSDAIHGAGEAGEDIIEGITNAAGDLVEGFDGNSDNTTTSESR